MSWSNKYSPREYLVRRRKRIRSVNDLQALPTLQELLATILSSVAQLPSEVRSDLEEKLERCADDQSELVLADYLDHLFSCLDEALDVHVQRSEIATQVRPTLIELLARIRFTGEFMQASQSLRKKLRKGTDLKAGLHETKQLLLSYITELGEQNREIRSFLTSLEARLQSLSSGVNDASEQHRDQSDRRSGFSNHLSDRMNAMQKQLTEERDVDRLKTTVQSYLDKLQDRIEEEKSKEEQASKKLQQKIQQMNTRVKELETHASELEHKIREKHEQAMRDSLTGLYNRNAYDQEVESAILDWAHEDKPSTLLVWDIDFFKKFNDRFGHSVGDRVLASVAAKLMEASREQDFVARYGGEEFVMLLHNTKPEEAEKIAERIRMQIEQSQFTFKNTPITITASCGLASFAEGDSAASVFERADKALYKAKQKGRNRVYNGSLAA